MHVLRKIINILKGRNLDGKRYLDEMKM